MFAKFLEGKWPKHVIPEAANNDNNDLLICVLAET